MSIDASISVCPWGLVSLPLPPSLLWDTDITKVDLAPIEKHGTYLSNTVLLDDLCFPYNDLIRLLAPVVQEYFQVDITGLRVIHSTLVNFTMDGDRAIRYHTDRGSVITINYCLYSDAVGNEIIFRGERDLLTGALHNSKDLHTVQMRTGWVYIHRGDHVHRTAGLLSGSRYSAILWMGECLPP